MPSPDYFPFTSISANVLPADAFPLTVHRATSASSPFRWLWRIFGEGRDTSDTTRIEVPREPHPDDGDVNLARALQYAPATGLARTQEFIRAFTERVHAPVYNDWTTLVHTGNTDG
jgi:aromatic amino acid aminotransferase I